jgi:hypothetical protein
MKKLLFILVVIAMLFAGYYFFRLYLSSTSTHIKDQLIQELSQKNNWDASKIELTITTIKGNFAKGEVKRINEMGGGIWFAANVDGAWKIVYDGNGVIPCDQLTKYQNFPKDLLPSCYDKQTDTLLSR